MPICSDVKNAVIGFAEIVPRAIASNVTNMFVNTVIVLRAIVVTKVSTIVALIQEKWLEIHIVPIARGVY